MDRRVKERLIGASILVAIIVLVVPALLSGPKPTTGTGLAALPAAAPEPTRNVTVDLSTSRTLAEPDLNAAPAVSASATTSPAPAAAMSSAAPLLSPQSSASSPAVSAAMSPVNPVRGWTVQLGSFASHGNANALSQKLRTQGFMAHILAAGSGSAARYRVFVGPVPDRAAAERAASKLRSLGHPSSIIGPAA